LRVVVHRVRIAHPPIVVFLAALRQVLLHIPPLVNLATLHFHLVTENTFHTGSQRFRSVHHHQIPPLQIQSSIHQIFQQPFDYRGVLRRSLPHSQNVLFSAFRDPQRHHQHLATKVNAIDHQHHQIQILQSSFAQQSQLIATGSNKLSAHTALLDPVAFHNTLHRSPIVPRGQPGHHALLHRSLQLSVLLQLTVALQFHFLAFARSYPRPLQRNFLSTENHITRLLSPAHATRCRIG